MAAQNEKETAADKKAAEAPEADYAKKHGPPESKDKEEKANDSNGKPAEADSAKDKDREKKDQDKEQDQDQGKERNDGNANMVAGATVPQPPGSVAAGSQRRGLSAMRFYTFSGSSNGPMAFRRPSLRRASRRATNRTSGQCVGDAKADAHVPLGVR